MKQIFSLMLILASLQMYCQDTIVKNSNMHGFRDSLVYINPTATGIDIGGDGRGSIDTILNLTGYDSIKVSVESKLTGQGQIIIFPCKDSSTITSDGYFSCSYIYQNIDTLTFDILLYHLGWQHPHILMRNLQIIGYPSLVTVIKANALLNNNFLYCKDRLIFKEKLKGQKLSVYDLYGKVLIDKMLESVNIFDLTSGIYFIRVLDEGKTLYSNKIYFEHE